MSNKYVWVGFNLFASIAVLVFLLMLDLSNVDAENLVVVIGLYAAAGWWIYRSVIYWRKCIQADDPEFNQAVCEITERTSKVKHPHNQ